MLVLAIQLSKYNIKNVFQDPFLFQKPLPVDIVLILEDNLRFLVYG